MEEDDLVTDRGSSNKRERKKNSAEDLQLQKQTSMKKKMDFETEKHNIWRPSLIELNDQNGPQ